MRVRRFVTGFPPVGAAPGLAGADAVRVRGGQSAHPVAALGPQRWDTALGELRGHTFHHSLTTSPLAPEAHTAPGNKYGRPEAVYRHGPVRASYFHAWFASDPVAAASLFLGADA